MSKNNTSLPAEALNQIEATAIAARLKFDREIKEGVTEESRHHFLEGVYEGGKFCATEYATKLHTVKLFLMEIVSVDDEMGFLRPQLNEEIKKFLHGE